jgi:uncharacterized membrane protein
VTVQGGNEQKGSGPAAAGPSVRDADDPAGRFLAGVRAALADLPASEVDEILDDVRSHLSDIAAELGDALDDRAVTARLGTPDGYAAELRAAAGYPPPPPAPAPAAGQRSVLAGLAVAGLVLSPLIPLGLAIGSEVAVLFGLLGVVVALPALFTGGPGMSAVAELPGVGPLFGRRPLAVGPTGRFVADLQLAWWVVRALLAAVAVAWIFGGGSWPAGLLLALVGVPVSIWLGRFGQRDRRVLWLVVPLNVLAVLVAGGVAARTGPEPSPDSVAAATAGGGLYQDGQEVRDIRPVDANGVPLTGVYLFDQDGHPIDTQGNTCAEYSPGTYTGGGYYDQYGDQSTGAVQPYPRGTAEYGSSTGRCVVVPPGPLVVAVPPPAAGPTAPPPPTTIPGAGSPTSVAVPPAKSPSSAPPTG